MVRFLPNWERSRFRLWGDRRVKPRRSESGGK